jgi:hypothetical protein
MRLAVISCWAYRDAWAPFFALLEKFWPNHPQAWLLTEHIEPSAKVPNNVQVFSGPNSLRWSWCQVVRAFALTSGDEPILLMQEDFFLSGPVNTGLIERALVELELQKAGSVRVYPCPGGDIDYGNPYFAEVQHGTSYRISCQATIWRPSFLAEIARFRTPFDFEVLGGPVADNMPDKVLAFKRDVHPWPMEYLCTGIIRGKWMADSRALLEANGIPVDFSMRKELPIAE